MPLKSEECYGIPENTVESNNSDNNNKNRSDTILSEPYISDTLLKQVVAERDTLRIQNDQLWKIIEKQRTIIQQLQKVSSKNSALLRQQIAEKRSLEEFGVPPLKLTSSSKSLSHLRKDSSERFTLVPLSPNSLESHTDEVLLQIDLSRQANQSSVKAEAKANLSLQPSYDKDFSVITHTRTISLDSKKADCISTVTFPQTPLSRVLTSPLSMNTEMIANISSEEKHSFEPKTLQMVCPPSLPLGEELLKRFTENKTKLPLSPVFLPPTLKSGRNEDKDKHLEIVKKISNSSKVDSGELTSVLDAKSSSIPDNSHETLTPYHARCDKPDQTFDLESVEIAVHQKPQESIEFVVSNVLVKNSDKKKAQGRGESLSHEDRPGKIVKEVHTKKGLGYQAEADGCLDISILDKSTLAGHRRDGSTTIKSPESNTIPGLQILYTSECEQIESILSSEVFTGEKTFALEETIINTNPDSQCTSKTSTTSKNVDKMNTDKNQDILSEVNNRTSERRIPASSQDSFSHDSPDTVQLPVVTSMTSNLVQSSYVDVSKSPINESTTLPIKPSSNLQSCRLHSLVGVDIRVTGSTIQINPKGKEVVAFLIGIGKRSGLTKFHELWTVEKYYSDFLALDAKLKRTQPRNIVLRVGKLPDRTLFFTNAPSKVDQRKLALQKYLQHLISLNPTPGEDICEFLSTNVSEKAQGSQRLLGVKEGYLTKRGKNFGGWKRRYFVLKSPILQYYEAKEGSNLGSIKIPQCQVSKQVVSMGTNDTAYRHAFIIIEPKKNGSGVNRHILCADSDIERDEWVSTLNIYTHSADPNITPVPTASVISEVESEGSKSGSQVSVKKGGKFKKFVKNDPPKTCTVQVDSPILRAGSPISPSPSRSPNVVNHRYAHSLETNNQGRMVMSRVNRGKAESPNTANFSKSIHRKSISFKERLLQSSSTPPVPLLPIDTDTITSNPSPLSPIKSKKPFGGGFTNNIHNKEKETSTQRKRTPFGWGRKIFSGSDSKNRAPLVPIFGAPLEKAVEISRVKDGYELPAVVHRCIEYLDSKGAHKEEGIYRLSGSTATVRILKEKFNSEGDYNILKSGIYYDVHAVSGVLKLYLRELPISVLTRSRHSEFLHVTDLLNRRERVNELGRLISTLPLANYTILRCLIAHLIRIVQHSDINKMTVRNIGIVFSPTLGIPAGVFNLLMAEFEYIFWINDDGCAAPKKIESSESEEEGKSKLKEKTDKDLMRTPESKTVAVKVESAGSPEKNASSEGTDQPTRRHPKIRVFLQDQVGRSNRNSIIYVDSAPQEFVKMEKTLQGLECEEEDLYDLVDPTNVSVSDAPILGSIDPNEGYLNLVGDAQSMDDSEYSYEPGEENSVDVCHIEYNSDIPCSVEHDIKPDETQSIKTFQ